MQIWNSYYPYIMLSFIFPSKIWAKNCALYRAKYGIPFHQQQMQGKTVSPCCCLQLPWSTRLSIKLRVGARGRNRNYDFLDCGNILIICHEECLDSNRSVFRWVHLNTDPLVANSREHFLEGEKYYLGRLSLSSNSCCENVYYRYTLGVQNQAANTGRFSTDD